MATRVSDGGHGSANETPLLFAVQGHSVTGVEVLEGSPGGVLIEFGGARLEVLSKACIWVGERQVASHHPQWREALGRCIAARVARVAVEEGHELSIEFDNGLRLAVSLDEADQRGPEAAAFFDEHWHYEAF